LSVDPRSSLHSHAKNVAVPASSKPISTEATPSSHGKPIASRTLVETMIAAMAEEARGILRGDAVEGGTERLFECLDGAGRDTAQV
jgi:hypothetical protein